MNFINNYQRLSEYVLLIMTCFFAVGINMPIDIIPVFLVFWICSIIIYTIFHFKPQNLFLKDNIVYLFLVLFYLWSIATLFFTSDFKQGFRILETRLSIFIVSILFILFNQDIKNRTTIIKFFILGNVISIVWCLIVYNFSSGWGPSEHRIRYLSLAIKGFKHYNYIGINLSVGLFFIAYLIRKNKLLTQLIIFTLFSALYFLFIYITQSRMSLLVIIISILVISLFIIIKLKRFKIIYSIIILLIAIASFFVLKNSPAIKGMDLYNLTLENIDTERTLLWKTSINSIKNNFIFGQGIGDSYLQQNDESWANSHNQILSFLLEGGIISVLLFFGSWVSMFFATNKRDRFYVFGILMIFFLFLMIESTFNRIANIGLFVFILFVIFKTREDDEIQTHRFSYNTVILFILPLIIFLIYTYYKTFDKVEFNSLNPATYATLPHQSVPFKMLPGDLIVGINEEAIGYKLDKTSFANSWNGNSYSYTKIADLDITQNDSIMASVFCYVSHKFNGTWVRLSCESNSNDFKYASYYDLNNKGTWQKLSLISEATDIDAKLYLFFSKFDSENFNGLEGYVIFAQPYYQILSK